jgi:glycosyltransferase involved in cell wall biosynthesis
VGVEAFLVSAAIPAYNEAERIAAAIASARNQTEPPAEILVVDDGSTDGTAKLAASLGARVVSTANCGIANARNTLLTEARFPWLAFLDADDLWYPDKLATLRRAHATCPEPDVIISDLCRRGPAGEVQTPSVFASTPQFRALPQTAVGTDCMLVGRSALGEALAVGNFIGTSTVAVRREALLARGDTFSQTLPASAEVWVAEDVEWYLRVLRSTDVLVVTRVLGEYVMRGGSLASNYGRVRYGDLKLGERVVARPEAYVPGAAAAFVRERRAHFRDTARIFAGARDFARAAAVLREAQRERPEVRDTVALALLAVARTAGGRAAFEALRRLREAIRSRRTRVA